MEDDDNVVTHTEQPAQQSTDSPSGAASRNLQHRNRQACHRHRLEPRMPKGDGAFYFLLQIYVVIQVLTDFLKQDPIGYDVGVHTTWCLTLSYPMSAYDISIYGHWARYNRIQCRVRCLELHDLDFSVI